MNIPASLATVLAILGIRFLFNGSSQMRPDVVEERINGEKVELYNKAEEGLNMRKFIGVVCIMGATLSGFAALGLTVTRKAGIEEDGAEVPHDDED